MTSPANAGDAYAEAAGDPGEAADMPVLTGNSPEAGQRDVEFDESAVPAENAETVPSSEGAQP